MVFEAGRKTGEICVENAPGQGLTVIDLSDSWAPVLFSEDPVLGDAGKQPYLATFLALARGQFGSGPRWQYARDERYFELYGIFPVFSLLRERLVQDDRHACHDRIDSAPITGLRQTIRQESATVGRKRIQTLTSLERGLEQQRKRRKLASIAELAEVSRYYARQVARLEHLRTTVAAIRAVQEHLVCEGLLERKWVKPGLYDWRTASAVGAFQRKHMYLADDNLGEHTREAFVLGSREHDARAVLRALRERVVDATGLIEDGSAREEWGQVLGRYIDAPEFRVPTGHPLPEDGAPDLISRTTEAAAKALGWEGFETMRVFFAEHAAEGPVSLRVAVRLPPPPEYHSLNMELHAVIDRGDVWYEFPGYFSRGCVSRKGDRRPTLTLYAIHGDRKIALVRWHTTIGGWNRERMPGGWVALRYKNSDIGRRYWRDLVVSPAWFPPPTTPDAELVRRTSRGVQPKYDTFGPSYRSAYGLVMLVHHQLVKRRSGPVYEDNGIRTHGSSNYNSITRGCSHGCHRLFNHQALRLGSFLLRHRTSVRHGTLISHYSRRVAALGRAFNVRLDTRGYLYELVPPVVVDVTEGRVRGRRRTPITGARSIR